MEDLDQTDPNQANQPDQPMAVDPMTVDELRRSFFYGSRSNLNFKFSRDLSDDEFATMIEEMFAATAKVIDGADPAALTQVVARWQVQAYRGHLGDPDRFPHRHDDVPLTPLAKPLNEAKVMVMTSSGHFVAGDDPEPFGVVGMTQAEAEARIGEFLKVEPSLSAIPADTAIDRLRVRHGGYPVEAVAADHQVVLPLGHLRDLATAGAIGSVAEVAYSFVGATAQGRLKRDALPKWVELARAQRVDAVLLVPI